MNKTSLEDINDLIIRFMAGQCLPEEEVFLSDWKKQSCENAQHFNELKDTWLLTSQHKPVNAFDEEKSLRIIYQNLFTADKSEKTTRSIGIYLRIAAIIILAMGLGFFASYIWRNQKTDTLSYVRFVAPIGSRSIAYLPDGTVVWLNAGSELKYDLKGGKNSRNVDLVGEAFFKVKTDASRPFIVKTSGLNIKALGTSFNVKAYPEDKKVTTTLVEGVVKIEGKLSRGSNSFSITMKPKQKVVFYNDNKLYSVEQLSAVARNEEKEKAVIEKKEAIPAKVEIPAITSQNINTDLYTSWKDNRWIVEAEEFGGFSKLLERRYNVNIEFSSDELKKFRFSGTIQNETIEQVLDIMKYTIPFSYTMNKEKIVVYLDKNLMKKYNSAYLRN